MKFTTLLLSLLFAAGLFGQEYSISIDEPNYYLSTIETVDNGTAIDDTIKNISFLGETSVYQQALWDINIGHSNEYVRKINALQALNQDVRDRNLTNAALLVGVDLDSLNDLRYADRLLIDTAKIIVFTNRLTAAEVLLWTADPSPPNRIVGDLVGERRPNGNIRINTNGEAYRVIMEGPRMFRVNGFPGADAFYLESETDRLLIFRTTNIGPAKVKILFYKEAADRVSNTGLLAPK